MLDTVEAVAVAAIAASVATHCYKAAFHKTQSLAQHRQKVVLQRHKYDGSSVDASKRFIVKRQLAPVVVT